MIDVAQVTLDALTKRHPERVRWEPLWSDYRLQYRGGDDYLRAAGQLVNTRISSLLQSQVTNALTPQSFAGLRNRRFLYQFEGEPDPSYYALWNRAYYINYLSAILDYFRHWLFSEDPVIRSAEGKDPPDWWVTFWENATGSGKDFTDFVRDVFLDVLLGRRAGWLIGRNTAIAERGNDDGVVLTPYPAEQIYDWERDPSGELLWVVLGTHETIRQFPNERVQVETYTYADREQWATWQVARGDDYQKAQARAATTGDPLAAKYENKATDELQLIASGAHDFGVVPFVMLEVPEGLWIADKLSAPCKDIFNKQNRLTNAQLIGCILQPYIKTNEQRETATSRILGDNILLHLRVGSKDEESEDFGWKSAETGPLEFIGKQIQEQRDEIYRIVHQMALAVDSKSIGAIARSGASKIEDRKASEIILAAYGGYVSEAMLRTANVVSKIMGDGTEWTLDGFKNFNVSSLDEEIQIAALAQSMQLKSKTAKEELELKVVGRLLDHLDEKTMETIEKETRDGYDQEEENQMAPQMPGAQLPTAQGEQKQPFGGIKPPKSLGDKTENAKAAYGQG